VCVCMAPKYAYCFLGLTFTEKWNTDNTLATEITIEDQLVKGLKLSFDTQFAPQTGKKSGKIKTGYKQEYINANCDVDFDFAGPTINGAAVVGYVTLMIINMSYMKSVYHHLNLGIYEYMQSNMINFLWLTATVAGWLDTSLHLTPPSLSWRGVILL